MLASLREDRRVDIVPINDSFGAEIAGVDLCDLDGDAFAEIAVALWQFAVLVFPGQDLDQED